MGENDRDGQDGRGARLQDAATGERSQTVRRGPGTGERSAGDRVAGNGKASANGTSGGNGRAAGSAGAGANGVADGRGGGRGVGKGGGRGVAKGAAPSKPPKQAKPRRRRRNRGALLAFTIGMLACLALIAVLLIDAGTLCGMGGFVYRTIQAYCP